MFLACAAFGYYVAQNFPPAPDQPAVRATPDGAFEEHRFLIIQVDRLDSSNPQLVSVWFTSLYFVENSNPTITFGQLYSPHSSRDAALNLQESFSLDGQGEPGKAFWKAVSAFGLEWEAYFMVDQLASEYILQWVNGPGEYISKLDGTEETRAVLQQTCDSLGSLSGREAPAFDWTVIAPLHFGSNIRMERAMDYWNHITRNEQPPHCEVILAP